VRDRILRVLKSVEGVEGSVDDVESWFGRLYKWEDGYLPHCGGNRFIVSSLYSWRKDLMVY
jgi:hypothetical protein